MGTSDDLEDTPLHEAVRYSDISEARTALKKGCDPNKIGLYQWSALHEAANNGDAEIIKLLLRNGGDPNQPDLLQGCSALHYAASQGHLQCLHLLVDAGGKWDMLDANEKTSFDVATGECVSYLRKFQISECSDANHSDTNNNGCNVNPGVPPGEAGDKQLLTKCCSRENLEKVILENTQPDLINHDSSNKKPSALISSYESTQRSSRNSVEKRCIEELHSGMDIISHDDSRSTSDMYSLEDSKVMSSKSSDTSSVIRSDSTSACDSALDPDEVSLTSLDSLDFSLYSSSGIAPRAWTHDGPVVGVGRKLILGHIVLSFEYNSKKSTFRIRVWQVSDLLMPPVETSMISGIYVKSYLMPDKRKETKRKTEELPVYKPSDNVDKNTDPKSTSDIFKPSTFSFKKAPEYKKVTPSMVNDKIVHLEVCTVQKYTRRSYVLATFNMPMSEAVKKLVKQRYPLTPRISTELPENMKVYDGSDLKVSHQRPYRSFHNSPVPSTISLPNDQKRSSSDTNLKAMRINDISKTSSIEITVPPDGDDVDDLEHDLQKIKIMEKKEADKWTCIPMTVIDSDEELDLPTDLAIVKCDVHDVKVHLPTAETEHVQSYINPAFDWRGTETKPEEEKKKRNSRKFSFRKPSISKGLKRDKEKSKRDSGFSQSDSDNFRPETPSFLWDDYMEPLQTTLEPVTFDDDFGFEMDGPVLPMVTSMDMPRVHGNSFSRTDNNMTTSFTESPSKLYNHSSSPCQSSNRNTVEEDSELSVVTETLPTNKGEVSIIVNEPEVDSVFSESPTMVTRLDSALDIPEEIKLDVVNETKMSIKVSPKTKHKAPHPASGSQNARKPLTDRHQETKLEMSKFHTAPQLELGDDFTFGDVMETNLI